LSTDGNHGTIDNNSGWMAVDGDWTYLLDTDGVQIYKINPAVATSRPGGDQVRINPSAWSGSIVSGDKVIFSTAINIENLNVENALYNIMSSYAGKDDKLICCSSKFVNKDIGT